MQHLPPSGGRGKLLNNDQELAIEEMVVANNAIKLHEIQTRIVVDHEIFDNISPKTGKSLPSTLFTFPQPHRGVIFYMEVEGL